MLGLVLSLIVTASAAPPPASASVTCPDGPASCDAAAVAPTPPVADDDAEAPRYATPAVIDCRGVALPAVLQTLVGECDGTPRDASYRASRYPESEQNAGGLAPARQAQGRARALASCEGLPPAGGDLTVTSPQPMALSALPFFEPDSADVPRPGSALELPFRTTDPPERPPRA